MHISTFVQTAKVMPATIAVLLSGETGIGKSEVVSQLAEHFNLELIDRRVSQMCEGDLLGVPSVVDGTTRFNPPEWFKRACDRACLLFLDETNRGDPQVLQGVFQIILDRRLGDYQLHPNTRVYCAINMGVHFQVQELDPAFINRLAVFDIEPSVDEWVDWARDPKKGNLPADVVNFINSNRVHLERQKGQPYQPGKVYPSRRQWTRFARAAAQADLFGDPDAPAFTGLALAMLGHEAKGAFVQYLKTVASQVSAEDIVKRFKKVEKKLDGLGNERFTSINEKLFAYVKEHTLTADEAKNLGRYFRILPGEILVAGWTKLAECGNMSNIQSVHPYIAPYILLVLGKPVDGMKGPDGENPKEFYAKKGFSLEPIEFKPKKDDAK